MEVHVDEIDHQGAEGAAARNDFMGLLAIVAKSAAALADRIEELELADARAVHAAEEAAEGAR